LAEMVELARTPLMREADVEVLARSGPVGSCPAVTTPPRPNSLS
jgi:hypothetical protein